MPSASPRQGRSCPRVTQRWSSPLSSCSFLPSSCCYLCAPPPSSPAAEAWHCIPVLASEILLPLPFPVAPPLLECVFLSSSPASQSEPRSIVTYLPAPGRARADEADRLARMVGAPPRPPPMHVSHVALLLAAADRAFAVERSKSFTFTTGSTGVKKPAVQSALHTGVVPHGAPLVLDPMDTAMLFNPYNPTAGSTGVSKPSVEPSLHTGDVPRLAPPSLNASPRPDVLTARYSHFLREYFGHVKPREAPNCLACRNHRRRPCRLHKWLFGPI